MIEPLDHLAPGPTSTRRRRALHLGLLRWEGFVYPELYVDADRRLARSLGRAAIVLTFPPMLAYLAVQKLVLRRTQPGYRGRDAPFRHSSGPIAYCHVALERLGVARPTRADAPAAPVVEVREPRLPEPASHSYLVIDDFYEDPDAVRAELLEAPLRRYEKGWFTTALGDGTEHAVSRERARLALECHLGLALSRPNFDSDCNGRILSWNGALHVKLAENWLATDACCIHNHANLDPRSWTGVVYLNPEPPPWGGGTELLRRRSTGRAVESDKCYDARVYRFEVAAQVAPIYNRLVLFPSGTLHRGDAGFGHDRATGRAFQTLFFEVDDR